ncbi:hypothetical protein QFZ82_006595 [Streptomyces sp. V4I23]|uniref:hypothetical protein n=1 Tax=Streptomyces sp. V4I23 TaxID=3042282 RepID=UPI0027851498|nr:hypothetical protein [Streptomyces sp. V4I23]MDQ1012110.1 hypothetical protein [Streptomyces sp. V4I23]
MTDTQLAITEEQISNAKLVWDFHQMHHDVRPSSAVTISSHSRVHRRQQPDHNT